MDKKGTFNNLDSLGGTQFLVAVTAKPKGLPHFAFFGDPKKGRPKDGNVRTWRFPLSHPLLQANNLWVKFNPTKPTQTGILTSYT